MRLCSRTLLLALLWNVSGTFPACSQSQPLLEIVAKIADQLPKTLPSRFRFEDAHLPIDPVCGMQTYNVTLWRDTGARHTFSMLSDPPGRDRTYTNIVAVTSKFEVDADGSPRAYSAEDPSGQAHCALLRDAQGHYVLSGSGRCALDTFGDAGIYVFDGAKRLRDRNLTDNWRKLWLLVSNRNLKPLDLSALVPLSTLTHYYLFYWQDRNMTVVFDDRNIPRTALGYPCVRSARSRFPGYFISLTTLQNDQDQLGAETGSAASIAPPECKPFRNIDSESVPYLVIPGGMIGGTSIGDLAVARFQSETVKPLVYGVIADAGPIAKIGEGSIAFNQQLKGMSGPIINNNGLNQLAIDDGRTIGIVMLGGTKKLLNGNYTRENIEKVARSQLERWGGKGSDPTIRLNACLKNAAVN
jgi:hypothetical protein